MLKIARTTPVKVKSGGAATARCAARRAAVSSGLAAVPGALLFVMATRKAKAGTAKTVVRKTTTPTQPKIASESPETALRPLE